VIFSASDRLATRVFLAGRKTLGRLVNFVRIPLMIAAMAVIPGLLRHESGWTLAVQASQAFAVGVGGQIVYLLIKTTRRVVHIRRERRDAAA
jgi:hypothetical protein